MKGIWARWFGRRDAPTDDPVGPGHEHHHGESFEDRQADEFVEEHLGGVNPERLLPDEEPPRDN
jgi:hypothetical protein